VKNLIDNILTIALTIFALSLICWPLVGVLAFGGLQSTPAWFAYIAIAYMFILMGAAK